MIGEFDLIARYFAPLAGAAGLGLVDDAACLIPPDGKDLIISKDMLVAGVHFFADDLSRSLAFKALSVNISDLAAKGASPYAYFLGLSIPVGTSEKWFEDFAAGLADAQAHYGIELAGGDTTSTGGPITISITAIGHVAHSAMVRRNGAAVADRIYVTGTLGDAAFGLCGLRGECAKHDDLLERYHRPVARHQFGQGLSGLASASADVSDGLVADLGHICRASGVGALLKEAAFPLSPNVERLIRENQSLSPLVWSGGDDYEIVFTAPYEGEETLMEFAKTVGVRVTEIGEIVASSEIELVDSSGKLVQIKSRGFTHF